jgi:ferredoxin
MAAVRALLQAAGYDMARYREESFSFEAAAPAQVAANAAADAATAADASTTVAHFAVHLKKRGDQFECASGQTVLQAATAAGLRLPFSCSNGVCGTCRTQKVSGEVDMKQNGGLRPREVAQGWFLPCCSTPLSDLVLDR